MTVLITGGSGFLGSHITNLASASLRNPVTNISVRGDGFFEPGDKPGAVRPIVDMHRFDEVETLIHAGAFTPKSKEALKDFISPATNISSTSRLLSLEWPNLRKLIFLSTIDVYGRSRGVIDETSSTNPQTLYAQSKFFGETQVKLFGAQRDVSTQILRVGHVYGPGEDRYQKLIPESIRRVIAGRELYLSASGEERRSYIYVTDVAKAVLNSLEAENYLGVVNVVGERSYSAREVVEVILSFTPGRSKVILQTSEWEPVDSVFDASKLKEALLPVHTDLRVGLEAEFEYFKGSPRVKI